MSQRWVLVALICFIHGSARWAFGKDGFGQESIRSLPSKAETVIVNANILCCDLKMSQATSIAFGKGRVLAVGNSDTTKEWIGPSTQVTDLHGQTLTPGFCDSHLHFAALGESLERIDLRTANNWSEVVELVVKQAAQKPAGEWIEGRGWHQSKWNPLPTPNIDGYPLHDLLSRLVPNHPVVLGHASGHACIANAMAMELASVDRDTEAPDGGEIVRDQEGNPIGLFRENAQQLIYRAQSKGEKSQTTSDSNWNRHIVLASAECLRNGITAVHDAGITFEEADRMAELADQSKLPIRINAMIREGSGSLLKSMSNHRWIDRGDGFLTIRSVKVAMDGALGPHGAWLLEPYDDLPSSTGLNTISIDELEKIAMLCKRSGWQLCVHAIGDRANRETLNVFEKVLGREAQADHRWRIEHAQHIHPNDLPRFKKLGVLPIMQANHCTSDAVFILERLGQRRASENAYRWRALVDAGSIVPNGTDAPVELVDPRVSLYASITRKLSSGESFFPNQCLTRSEGLLSYTLWPAIASFHDHDSGSIEVGKRADFVCWDTDLLNCADDSILKASVQSTWISGKQVYRIP